MYVCVYRLTWFFLIKRQGQSRFSLRTPTNPQGKWQATPRTLCGTQTLTVLWRHLLSNRKASVLNLILRDATMDRLGL